MMTLYEASIEEWMHLHFVSEYFFSSHLLLMVILTVSMVTKIGNNVGD